MRNLNFLNLHVLLHARYKTENTNDIKKVNFFLGGGHFLNLKIIERIRIKRQYKKS